MPYRIPKGSGERSPQRDGGDATKKEQPPWRNLGAPAPEANALKGLDEWLKGQKGSQSSQEGDFWDNKEWGPPSGLPGGLR